MKYDKLLENSINGLNALDMTVNEAPNIKTNIKNDIKIIIESFRNYIK